MKLPRFSGLVVLAFMATACSDNQLQIAVPVPLVPEVEQVESLVNGAVVSWNIPVDSGLQILGYNLLQYEQGQQTRSYVYGSSSLETRSRSAFIFGLSSDETYRFQVRARTIYGWSALSPLSMSTRPLSGASLNPSLTPIITNIVPVSDGIRVFWEPPEAQQGAIITGYRVTATPQEPVSGGGSANSTVIVESVPEQSRRLRLRSMSADLNYIVSIQVQYQHGPGGEYTHPVSVMPLGACPRSGSGSIRFDIAAEDDIYPAVVNSPYAGVLKKCLFNPGCFGTPSCTTSELPLIGQYDRTPDVDTIMNHVLVQKPWMAERLREIIEFMHPDALELFISITGIVIGDLRPSFYTVGTGAFYLDSSYVAVTPQHEIDIDISTPDFRSGFGAALQFMIPTRLMVPSDVVLDERNRSNFITGSVLIHELGHSLDFFPPDRLARLDRSIPVSENPLDPTSHILVSQQPLISQTLAQLAAVRFLGNTASDDLKALGPDQVGEEFAADGAVDWYNYTNQYEDLAMLVQRAWSWYAMGLDFEIAVTSLGSCRSGTADEPVVSWGERDRLGSPQIMNRLAVILDRITPGDTSTRVMQALDRLPPPTRILPGSSWCNPVYDESASLVADSNSLRAGGLRTLDPHGSTPADFPLSIHHLVLY